MHSQQAGHSDTMSWFVIDYKEETVESNAKETPPRSHPSQAELEKRG